MKLKLLFLSALLVFSTTASFSQITEFKANGWQINAGGGVDRILKTYNNGYFNPELGGLYGQLAGKKFWKMVGVGVNARYYTNGNTGLTNSAANLLISEGFSMVDQNVSNVQRLSLTAGPVINVPFLKNKFSWQLGVYGGYTYINGVGFNITNNSQTLLSDNGFPGDNYEPLAMATSILSLNIGKRWALGIEGHYNMLLSSKTNVNYLDLNTKNYQTKKYDFTSYGAGVSVTYKFGKSIPVLIPKVVNTPKVKDILVVVTDVETGLKLKNARVKLIESKGFFHNGVTDGNGEVIFSKMLADDYKIEAELNNVTTNVQNIALKDFDKDGELLKVGLEHSDPRFTLIGNTIEKHSNETVGGVYVILKNIRTGREEQILSNKNTGEFTFQLEAESNYSVFGRKDSFISEIEKMGTVGLKRSQNLYVKLKIALEETKVGKVIDLQNIYYKFDKADIDQVASRDLAKLLQYMKDNPKIKIEIDSHTDSRGTSVYNLQLSQKRAENVVNYLTENGIPFNRLVAKGHGELKLKNSCTDNVPCSEEEHAINRRTEFFVIE